LIQGKGADSIERVGNARRLFNARSHLTYAVFAVLAVVSSPLAFAQGPQREVSGDVRADRQRRRDAAAELRRVGIDVDWRLASWPELNDWVMRSTRARLLHDRFGVDVDWRAYGVAELADFEGRLIRVANLQRYGVSVDWRLYGAAQLDELQAVVERQRASSALEPVSPPMKTDTATRYDTDDVLPPTYLAQELARFKNIDEDDDVLPPSISTRPSRRREDRPLPPSRGMR
jgi:hypothetical protein